MPAKKTVKKVPVKKAPAVKKVIAKALVATASEGKVIAKIEALQKDGFAVTLKCEGRNKQVKCGECIIEYIRTNKPVELIGMKSGMAARTVQL